ncbi:hypothetical protein BDV93DRAFT_505393 [Ceratobasidium sp. AG-I]|nr:hypothetical protein BDV93DRAFT_505393 [Ceratobasidium sp. AG-I]
MLVPRSRKKDRLDLCMLDRVARAHSVGVVRFDRYSCAIQRGKYNLFDLERTFLIEVHFIFVKYELLSFAEEVYQQLVSYSRLDLPRILQRFRFILGSADDMSVQLVVLGKQSSVREIWLVCLETPECHSQMELAITTDDIELFGASASLLSLKMDEFETGTSQTPLVNVSCLVPVVNVKTTTMTLG